MLVYFALGDASFSRFYPTRNLKVAFVPTQPQRQPVEYRLHWVPGVGSLRWACTFHFFVLISFALGSRRRPSFHWNMGFTVGSVFAWLKYYI